MDYWESYQRPEWDSNPRQTDLQSAPLDHSGIRPRWNDILAGGAGFRQVNRATGAVVSAATIVGPRRSAGGATAWYDGPPQPGAAPSVMRVRLGWPVLMEAFMRRRGLSRVEMVVAAGALLVLAFLAYSALTPSLGPREFASRAECSNNIRQAILAMYMYEQNNSAFPTVLPPPVPDHFENDPMPSPVATRLSLHVFQALYRNKNHAGDPMACLWLLVLEGQETPKRFICPADPFTSNPSAQYFHPRTSRDFWNNFGGAARQRHLRINGVPGAMGVRGGGESYSIASPWAGVTLAPWWRALHGRGVSTVPLMADMAPVVTAGRAIHSGHYRNPGLPEHGVKKPYVTPNVWNSGNHGGDGENVGFADDHVTWHNTPFDGENSDNIYTSNRSGAFNGSMKTDAVKLRHGIAVIDPRWRPGKQGRFDTVMIPVQDISETKDAGGLRR